MWEEARPVDGAPQVRRGLPGGRRELLMQMGPFSVVVTEIPGHSLTANEWQNILLARRSYAAMWGSGDVPTNDPHDGRGSDARLYDTRHYLAWVREEGQGGKLVTMRKVSLVPSELSPEQRTSPLALLPVDVQIWRVKTREGRYVPLWETLRTHARRLAPWDGLADLRVAAIGQIGDFPHAERGLTRRRHERMGIAFAAIQLLATHGDPSLLYVCALCPEFQDRVLGVVNADGVSIQPDFTRTEDMLGLAPGSVSLDNALPEVQEHKAAFPGYFIDHEDAARVLAFLLDGQQITIADLDDTIRRVTACEPALTAAINAAGHRRLAEILTRPRLFKHLAPRIASDQPLSRMSGAEFRACLLSGTGDGPFSSTLLPDAWTASARAVLAAAEEKYGATASAGPGRPRLVVHGDAEEPGPPAVSPPAWLRRHRPRVQLIQ